MTHSKTTILRTSPTAGTLFLILGFVLAVIVITVRLNANWGVLSRIVARNPVMCWGIAVSFMAGGAVMIKQHSVNTESWSPRIPGQRFQEATLYTREDCTLCDEAMQTLSNYVDTLPPVQTVDVDTNPAALDDFGNCVPVLLLDGKIRFRGHINETLLQRLIDGTPPVRT